MMVEPSDMEFGSEEPQAEVDEDDEEEAPAVPEEEDDEEP